MALISFQGICNGTETKHSRKSDKDYQVTTFVDLSDGMKTIEIFGDLGLPKDLTPREYVLRGTVVNLSSVSIVSGSSPVKSTAK